METLKQFLNAVYSSITKRSDSYLEIVLSLASAEYVESVVALSESALYRRRFSSVYETLKQVEVDDAALLKATLELLRERCDELDGYEVYSGDSTFVRRNEARTLAARAMKRLGTGELVCGHESYWSMRLAQQETSWSGVALVERMGEDDTVTSKAARHLKLIDASGATRKLFVLDAGHGKEVLANYPECQTTDIVIRLKSNQVFRYPSGDYRGRGRPPKHGERFKLSKAGEPDEQQTIAFKGKCLRISTWRNLHYAKYSAIHGVVLKLEFLDKGGKPIFEKPIWLFSTALEAECETLARAYLWRSSHELSFRFMKQHLGLAKAHSSELKSCDAWYQLVALAMNLLLAVKDQLQSQVPAWYPHAATKPISQRQAQKQALSFFLKVDTPSLAPRPAGKAHGRAKGYHPPPRQRHPVIRKTPNRSKPCPSCPFKAAA